MSHHPDMWRHSPVRQAADSAGATNAEMMRGSSSPLFLLTSSSHPKEDQPQSLIVSPRIKFGFPSHTCQKTTCTEWRSCLEKVEIKIPLFEVEDNQKLFHSLSKIESFDKIIKFGIDGLPFKILGLHAFGSCDPRIPSSASHNG